MNALKKNLKNVLIFVRAPIPLAAIAENSAPDQWTCHPVVPLKHVYKVETYFFTRKMKRGKAFVMDTVMSHGKLI